MAHNYANRASDRRRKKWRENEANTFPREPQPVTRHEPPPMTDKNIQIWGGARPAVPLELTPPPVVSIMPPPKFAIAQLVWLLRSLTMVTAREMSTIRDCWTYYTDRVPNAAALETCLRPVAQLAPFDDRDAAADWIPQPFVLERKPEDEELPLVV